MNNAEYSPKAPHSTGLFGSLCVVRRGSGTGALAAAAALVAMLGVFALVSAPALANSGYAFTKSFGAKGSGAGELEDPEGVAVNDATHDVYVADTGNRRVDEFSSSGGFLSAFGWGVVDPGAEGTGNVMSGSEEVTDVLTTSRAFYVGQTLVGAGIPAGATIAAVGAGTITLSAPATASGAGVALSVAAGAGVVPTNAQRSVTIDAIGGTFTLSFTTPDPSNSAATTTSLPFDASSGELQAALEALPNVGAGNVAVSGGPSATGTGNLSAGSGTGTLSAATGAGRLTSGFEEVTGVGTAQGAFAVGQAISGTGIPAGTTIAAVGTETLTLSAPATVTSGATATALAAGSDEVKEVDTTAGAFAVGQEISGAGIPAGTKIATVGAKTLTLSAVATVGGAGLPLNAGLREVTGLTTTTGSYFAGEEVFGPGIPAGTKIEEVGLGTLTLSRHVTETGVGVVVDALAPYTVTFQGTRFADTDVAQLSIDSAGLTGGGGAPAAVSTSQTGGGGLEDCTAGSGCQAGSAGPGPGQLTDPTFIAVDNSAGGGGDVYVGEKSTGLVQKFTAAGALVASWGDNGAGESANGQLVGAAGTTGTGTYSAGVPAEGTGLVKNGSETITDVVTSKGAFAVGQVLHQGFYAAEFTGFPVDTVITAVGNGTITVSHPAAVFFGEVKGALVADQVITNVATSTGAFGAGQNISGPGIEGTIEAVGPGTLTVESNAKEAETGAALTAGPIPFGAGSVEGIAVSPAGDLWVSTDKQGLGFEEYGGTALEFNQGGSFIGFLLPSEAPGTATDQAVDLATNDEYVDKGSSIEERGSSGGLIASFGAPQLAGGAGLGVDSSTTLPLGGTVYAANTVADQLDAYGVALEVFTGPAGEEKATTATVSGEVNPAGGSVVECYFEYGTTLRYGQTAACESPDAAELGEGSVPKQVHADLKELLSGSAYHYRLVATHENAAAHEKTTVPGEDELLSTLAVPVVAGEEAVEVAASSWGLRATVNPEGLPVLRCTFEYGTTTAYGEEAPCEQRKSEIGLGTEPVSVSALLTGLAPNTEYHWRLVATDKIGSSLTAPGGSEDHTFVYSTAGDELPDHRAYEMVSPPFKDGGLVGDIFSGPGPAFAEDGSRLIAVDIQCFAPVESCSVYRGTNGEPFEFTRTPAGWVTAPLAPPATKFRFNNAWQLSPNEGTAMFSMPTGPEEEDEWYKREESGAGASFAPLGPLTPPGAPIGINSTGEPSTTADLSHVVWGIRPEFAGVQWSFDESTGDGLYEYAGFHNAQPLLVGVKGGEGSHELVSACGTDLGSRAGGSGGTVTNAVSADGRIVYFVACGKGLYARVDGETSEAHTVSIAPGGVFTGASDNGLRAFFLNGSNCSSAGSDCGLYESECTAHCEGSGEEESKEQRKSIDVSASSPKPEVRGVAGISADGTHVYFVANGVLTEAANASGGKAAPGDCMTLGGSAGVEAEELQRCNLYVYERDGRYPDGHTAFVASLPGSDAGGYVDIWAEESEAGRKAANVTPDGRFLVFESEAHLTPDDHASGIQIFRYDAGTEQLLRVSVGQDGFDDNGNVGTGEATIVSASMSSSEGQAGPGRHDPTMSNDGSFVFFRSPIGLTPHALNDVVAFHREAKNIEPEITDYAENVYEWEADGTEVDGQVTCRLVGGCVSLISDGHDTSTSATPCGAGSSVCLLGASGSGHDVFFMTSDQLVPKDTDTQVDIYDARVCEPESGNPCIAEPLPALPPCDGESCHGIPAATPSLLTPGSAGFNGEGNLAPSPPPPAVKPKAKVVKCKKGFTKNKRDKCVRTKKPKKKAKKSDRRTGR